MRVMRGWPVFVLMVSALIAGCRSVNTQTPALIEYQRSGGIAGQTIRLVVQDNGAARLSTLRDSTNLTIGADMLERLKNLVQSVRFDTLRAEYRPSHPGADLFEYILTHRGRRVRLQDGAIPAELQPLIDLLNGLVRPP